MHILPRLLRVIAIAVAAGAAGPASAQTDLAGAGCGHTIESVPASVQAILGPAYGGDATAPLKEVARQMEILMLEAGHCQAITQSFENKSTTKQDELVEWHSLNQWLYRLANFVQLNARGDNSIDWRKEYEVFAEVYQLKI